EDRVDLVIDPETVVFGVLIPVAEFDDELDLLDIANRGDPEQVLDVDVPQPADLHVVADHARPGAVDQGRPDAADVDDVVRDQPVPAADQIERRLALADAALAEQQHPDPEDVEEDPVDGGGRRQLGPEVLGYAGD